MRKRFARWGNNLLLLGCAVVCLWCVGTKFQAWAQEQGGDALLFAAGMQAQPASPPSGASASPSPSRAMAAANAAVMWWLRQMGAIFSRSKAVKAA